MSRTILYISMQTKKVIYELYSDSQPLIWNLTHPIDLSIL
jgi:hypothetical protein